MYWKGFGSKRSQPNFRHVLTLLEVGVLVEF
jgi:hypothetical protein